MTILPERLQDVLAAMRSASTQCAEFAGRIEAATALQPSVGASEGVEERTRDGWTPQLMDELLACMDGWGLILGERSVRDGDAWAWEMKDAAALIRALRTPAKAVTSHGALRKEEGMITGDELEALIDAAQTTNDSKAVSFLGQVSRELLVQLHGVEAALLAVGKRPPLCDTENAVRHAVGMPWVTSTGTQQEARVVGSGGET